MIQGNVILNLSLICIVFLGLQAKLSKMHGIVKSLYIYIFIRICLIFSLHLQMKHKLKFEMSGVTTIIWATLTKTVDIVWNIGNC